MFSNELIFVFHSLFLSGSTVIAARMSKECLISIIALFTVLSNAFILKETALFGLTATCTDSFTIGATLALNLLHQKYGYELARKAVTISSFCLALYMIASQFHLGYSWMIESTTNSAYSTILSTSPRIVFASLFSLYISQSLDCVLYKWLLEKRGLTFFESKTIISTTISQLIDTILFSYLALYGIINTIPSIILISFTIKIFALIISIPLIYIFKTYH